MEIPVQIILCDIRRIIAVLRTALRFPFDRRLDLFLSSDSENPLIIYIDIVMSVQFIPDSAISHIRVFLVNAPDLFCDLPIAYFAVTDRIIQPAIISSPGYMQVFAKALYRVILFF